MSRDGGFAGNGGTYLQSTSCEDPSAMHPAMAFCTFPEPVDSGEAGRDVFPASALEMQDKPQMSTLSALGSATVQLVYTSDTTPGYRRLRHGSKFRYQKPDGSFLQDKRERMRIRSLAIPPAYESVWICMLGNGHLQATGIDARGRKQYRYHPEWHQHSADRKFSTLPSFAEALPAIRSRVRRELAQPSPSRDRVIAGIVALLDLTGYRIGNSRYVQENRTFGLSSLLSRHMKADTDGIHLEFRGKFGLRHKTKVTTPLLTRLMKELQDLPGQHLFRYEDEEGQWHDIGTHDVNSWLKETGGGDFTAKQFRTWKASIICARELIRTPLPATGKEAERTIRNAIAATALHLNHTAATCRKYYIHPAILSAYRKGRLHSTMQSAPPRNARSVLRGLHADERRILRLLKQPLKEK